MRIAIIGASGFVGKNLVNHLLENTNHDIFAISLNVNEIKIKDEYTNRIKKINADVFDYLEIEKALSSADIAYYLIHMMANDKSNFYNKEILAAETVSKALKSNNVKRVIYMSGLGNDKEDLSKHLLSRHRTGDILRENINEVIELRASMIIGEGSISFEIVRNLINKSPIVTLPKWSNTKTQPIGISDALQYLNNSIDIKISGNEIIEIGGKETMSYLEFVKKYAKFRNKKTIIFRIPVLTENLAGYFLNFFNSREQSNVGKCMLGSFRNEMIVTNNKAKELFSNINPRKIEEFFI